MSTQQTTVQTIDQGGATIVEIIIGVISQPPALLSIALAWLMVYFISHSGFMYKVDTKRRLTRKLLLASLLSIGGYFFFARNLAATMDEMIDTSIAVGVIAAGAPILFILFARWQLPGLAKILEPDEVKRDRYKNRSGIGTECLDPGVVVADQGRKGNDA